MIIKELQSDNLKVKVYDSRNAMGKDAAKEAAEYLKKLLSTKEIVNVIFAAAPSQNEFLAALAATEDISWSRVRAFHMDEYIGLPQDAPQGFGNFLRRGIFDLVPFKEVHYLDGSIAPEEACAKYSALLEQSPTDIVFMGIGENGHIAFNDPHVAKFDDTERVKIVDLDMKCRMQQVHDGCFCTIDEVPTHALTLTIPSLFNAGRLFCMVPAATKADAVKLTVQGEVSEVCPATIMRRHANATLYVDSDSGKYLL